MLIHELLLLFSSVALSCVCNGNAGVTSAFVRNEWPSLDISLDDQVIAAPKGYNAPQQVHITQGDYDGKAVIISWIAADGPGSNKVRYGLADGEYHLTVEGTLQNYTFSNYTSGYIHHCLVDGLQYDTKYYYEIEGGNSSRRFWFRTPPPIHPDAPYKFGIIGDLGQTYNSLSTLEHSIQLGEETILYVGDLSYADRYQYHDVGVRWDSWGRLAERSAAYQPWIWVAGNHEIEYFPYMNVYSVHSTCSFNYCFSNNKGIIGAMCEGEVIPFRNYIYRYPTPYRYSGSSNPLWYAVRRASAHIIVLSSYSPYVKYTPQWLWLKEEFERVDRKKTPWLIVVMHVPMYNSYISHFMEGESMGVVFESWFCRYKVDLVLAGHVHAYERSYRISNIKYNVSSGTSYAALDESAPVYINVGDGGNKGGLAMSFKYPQPNYCAFREASYGHSTLEIQNRTHAFYHWNRNDDGKRVPTDHMLLHNQYWKSNGRRRRQKKINQ